MVALPSGASQPFARKAGMMPPVMIEEGTSAVTLERRTHGDCTSVEVFCGSVVVEDPVIDRVVWPPA